MKKSSYLPYILDMDRSATKGASLGSPMEVLLVFRALRSVVGQAKVLFEHRNFANFYVLCPDIIMNTRTAVRILEKQLSVLTSEYPEVDWGDGVDERVRRKWWQGFAQPEWQEVVVEARGRLPVGRRRFDPTHSRFDKSGHWKGDGRAAQSSEHGGSSRKRELLRQDDMNSGWDQSWRKIRSDPAERSL